MLIEHILILAVCGLGVFHGISLGLYLLVSSLSKNVSNRLLGILLLVFGLRISKSILLYFTSDLDFLFITLGLSLILSFGPLFFLYVKSALAPSFQLKKEHLGHFIPFGLFFLLNSFGLLNKAFYFYFGIYFIYLHFLIYIILSFVWQKRFWKDITTPYNPIKRKWIQYIHIGMAVIWCSYFMFLLDEIVPYILGPITYSLVIYPLSFWAIFHKVLLPEEKKYKNSRIDQQVSVQLVNRLTTYMEQELPFLNPNLKLVDLATPLHVSTHTLSQVINEHYQQNVQQFLNSHRIQAAQKMLNASDKAHLTISAIAFESGFNSLSAFNTAFKKNSQMTPSQYRKNKKEKS